MSFITQKNYKNYKSTWYDDNYPSLYKNNHNKFEHISKIYIDLRKLRNNLTHINPDHMQPNIKNSLETLLKETKAIIHEDILKNLKK